MPPLASPLLWTALLAGGIVASCATTPATLAPKCCSPIPGHRADLHALLTAALATPNEGESALALGRFVAAWRQERGDTGSGLVEPRAAAGRTFEIRFDRAGVGRYAPEYFDKLQAAADFRVKGIAHHLREGHGAPLVGLRENRLREPIERHYPPEAIVRPVTAVIHPDGNTGSTQRARIELLCAHRHTTASIAGRRRPLAADFSAAFAALLQRTGALRQGELRDLLTDTPAREARLYLMEPYDPRKEPLLMIHGLLDSPLKWAHLTNELRADPSIADRYQIWHFLYNTSAPPLYPGRLLRAQYRELRRLLDPELDDPASRRTTLVTHSMGGVVARGLIADPGEAFWKAAFTRPFASLDLSPEDRATLADAFFWKPDPSVRRVIFIAAPHRGSEFADNPFGRLGQRLFRPPGEFRDFFERVSKANPGAFTPSYAALGEGKLDSVGALSPRQPTMRILPDLPVLPGVALHSIVGDRGRKGPLEESSDGIVAYWSSHLDGIESELVVPADHSAVDHPGSLAEIRRILALPASP